MMSSKENIKIKWWRNDGIIFDRNLELVSKQLNHLEAILHAYAGGLNFMQYLLLLFFKKKMEILLHFLSFL